MLGLGANISGGSPVGIVGAAPPSDYFYESDFASDTFLFTGSDNTSEFLSSFQGVNNVIKLASTRNYSYAYLTSANTPLNGRYYKFEVTYYAESGSNVSSVQVSETGGNYSDIVESITYDEWVTHTSDAILFDNGDIGTLFIRAFHSSGGQIHISQLNIIDVTDQQPPVSLNPPPGGYYDGALDQSSLSYLGAAAAYSLRLVYSYYDGPAIRVRRASDNAEQDIGFSNGVLDTSTLSTFCSGTDGFVKVWYDQANGNDAVQATTANQPKIYDSATGVVLENGKPAVQFSATTFVQNSAGNIRTQNCAQVLVSKFTQTGTTQRIIDRTNVGTIAEFNEQYNEFYFFDGTQGGLGPVDLNQNLFFYNRRTSDDLIAWHKNSLLAYSTTGYASSNWPVSDGSSGFSYYRISDASLGANMNFQELITWNEDQSTNRTGIETNINDHYQIYWDGSETALFDTYSGASAGYSLRALSSSYTGPLVRVRRATDNAERDIMALYNGELDTSALATFCAGTDGFVVRWYDQSGNGIDATQTTTANQPKIYDSVTGVVLNSDSKSACDFNVSSASLGVANTFFIGNDIVDMHVVVETSDTTGIMFGCAGSEYVGYVTSGSNRPDSDFGTPTYYVNGVDNSITTRTSLQSYVSTGAPTLLSIEGGDTQLWGDFQSTLAIGSYFINSTLSLNGKYSEIIIYPSDQSANRAAIEANINTAFSIYGQSPTGFLADYPGAAAAYSLRQLISTATYAVAVRRDSDDAVLPIGFVDGELDTTTLAAFCSGANGFVSVWFDQSGEGNHATQATTARQPKIYDSVTGVVLENGVAALRFDGTDDYLQSPAISALDTDIQSSFVVATDDSGDTSIRVAWRSSYASGALSLSSELTGVFKSTALNFHARASTGSYKGVSNAFSTNQSLISTVWNASDVVSGKLNGVDFTTNNTTGADAVPSGHNFTRVGATSEPAPTLYWQGIIQAVIIYPSDQSANRAGIESNINDHYNIYS